MQEKYQSACISYMNTRAEHEYPRTTNERLRCVFFMNKKARKYCHKHR